MQEWKIATQRMLDWLEEHIAENPTLLDMSRQVGYSPGYCSMQFHRVMGQTMKRYVAGRRLALATLALRDTDERILDIAVRCGYSSQEAMTRAFTAAYGVTPYTYRKKPRALPLSIRKNILFPYDDAEKGEMAMSSNIREPQVRVEYIPEHKYIGIWDPEVSDYMSFWDRHDCDGTYGIIESMAHLADPVVTPYTAGWYNVGNGKKGYFFGFGVPADYNGEVPEGFEIRSFPGSYYLVFSHPPFDFLKENDEVMPRVSKLAWGFDPATRGFKWNDACQTYQRHIPETFGYEILRPVKR